MSWISAAVPPSGRHFASRLSPAGLRAPSSDRPNPAASSVCRNRPSSCLLVVRETAHRRPSQPHEELISDLRSEVSATYACDPIEVRRPTRDHWSTQAMLEVGVASGPNWRPCTRSWAAVAQIRVGQTTSGNVSFQTSCTSPCAPVSSRVAALLELPEGGVHVGVGGAGSRRGLSQARPFTVDPRRRVEDRRTQGRDLEVPSTMTRVPRWGWTRG